VQTSTDGLKETAGALVTLERTTDARVAEITKDEKSSIRQWVKYANPTVVVWTVWLGLTICLFSFLHRYSVNFPFMDEFEIVPALTGDQPITWRWLWSQHNEHRILLARLLYLFVTKITNYDFRAGAYLNVATLSASAAAMIMVAKRLRGGATRYSDAFFPLLILHWGQAENVFLSFHIVWLITSALATTVLLLIVQPGALTFRQSIVLASCTILLALGGGPGLAFVPASALCVLLVGWQSFKERGRLGQSLCVWLIGAVGVLLTGFYFVDYVPLTRIPRSSSSLMTMVGTVQFLLTGLGTIVRMFWVYLQLVLYVSLAFLAVGMWRTWKSRPDERYLLVRLLFFFAGIGTLAVGVARVRAAFFPGAMFSSRYVTEAALFWVASYLAWELIDWPALRSKAQVALCLLAALLFLPNAKAGLTIAGLQYWPRLAAAADIRAGVPLDEIVRRYSTKIYYSKDNSISAEMPAGPETLRARMEMLKRSQIGLFRDLKE